VRYLATFAVLAVAALALLALWPDDGAGRGGHRVLTVEEQRAARATSPDASRGELAEAPAASGRPGVATHGRLRYDDGAPAAGVQLHLAVGRPLRTRVFRNGDYPAKTVWLVTRRLTTRTAPNGAFRFPAAAAPAGARRVLYTESDSDAFVLQEYEREARAVRKVRITGVLRDARGEPLMFYPFGAQLGPPEDWQTRVEREVDSYVHAMGDLEVDPLARVDTETDEDGRFALRLVPGRNVFSFGEARKDGTLDLEISSHDTDLGDLTVPPRIVADPREPGPVHGLVLNLAGRPHAGAEVRLWAGNVGPPSHVARTDLEGRFSFDAIGGEHAIVWAVSTRRHHLVLPEQSSGTIRLPCNTPVVLRAPDPDEYYWVRPQGGLAGFFLFVREGILLGGQSLDRSDEVGLPVGRYHLALVTHDHRILEGPFVAREGGRGHLRRIHLTDTTQ
jgi:hypothetical protein